MPDAGKLQSAVQGATVQACRSIPWVAAGPGACKHLSSSFRIPWAAH
jgi:hypothetical protein